MTVRSIALPFPLAAPRPMLEPDDGPEPILLPAAAALFLHAALAIALFLLPVARLPRAPREDSVAVEILTTEQLDAATARPPPPARLAAPAAIAPEPPASAEPMTQATRFLSAGLLADPRSRRAREALPGLAPDERIIQLCNIEALEQVHTANAALYQPDFLVAYAMAEPKLSDHAVAADGGAFRSRRRWYQISYRCAVAPDLGKVVSFAYRVGDAIPEREWAGHGLAVSDGPTD